MRLSTCLLDTGPLIALLNRGDRRHKWIKRRFARFATPILSCDGVVVETQHLLRRAGLATSPLFELLDRGSLVPLRPGDDAIARTVELARKYASVPMAWTDACLVQLSELHRTARICTFDRDFLVYRRFVREPLPLEMPRR